MIANALGANLHIQRIQNGAISWQMLKGSVELRRTAEILTTSIAFHIYAGIWG